MAPGTYRCRFLVTSLVLEKSEFAEFPSGQVCSAWQGYDSRTDESEQAGTALFTLRRNAFQVATQPMGRHWGALHFWGPMPDRVPALLPTHLHS